MNTNVQTGAQVVPVEDKKTYEETMAEKKCKITRKEFRAVGKYGMPLIEKCDIEPDTIELMSYKKSKNSDAENAYKTLHFFIHDWHFDNTYDNSEKAMEKLGQYYALLTPDFSMYWDMPLALQIYSTFKNRWCGAYWQSFGIRVIPTVNWGDERSFEFCFDGIEQGSVVAVSTYCREQYKNEFMVGYKKMLETIKPSAIICYGDLIPGMTGNIKIIQPYNYREISSKIGTDECVKRYFAGELYPSN